MSTPRRSQVIDDGQRGAVLPLMAILLIVLMGAAAMAVDLGWLYWQSVEIQHGADAAALAGVVYEPDFSSTAHTEATAAALENGYDGGASGTTVEVYDVGDGGGHVDYDNQLKVTITHEVGTFFMKVFGLDTVNLTRSAIAQYTPPLLMGSPEQIFGRDYSQYAPASASDPGYWASISGTYGPASWGDRHSSPCKDKTYIDGTSYGDGYGLVDTFGNDCIVHDDYRWNVDPGLQTAAGGYLYGIHVDSAPSGLALEIFDGPLFAQRRYGSGSHTDDWTGDYWPKPSSWSRYNSFGPADELVEDDFITYFMLYGPDTTPLTTEDNELLCVVSFNAFNDAGSGQPADDDGGREQYYAFWDTSWSEFSDIPAATINLMWEDLATLGGCGSLDRGPGIYPLRVMMEHNEPGSCPGLYPTGGCPYAFNKYALRVSASSGSPTISALQDMSIFANDVAWSSTEFYLAKVDQKYAGKDLVVEFFDAGDFGGSNPNPSDTVEVIAGNGDTLSCEWLVLDLDGDTDTSGTGCSFNMILGGGSAYDNRIVQFTIGLPASYACSGDGCWFRVKYNYTGSAAIQDVTTWSAYISGNPIRIVE